MQCKCSYFDVNSKAINVMSFGSQGKVALSEKAVHAGNRSQNYFFNVTGRHPNILQYKKERRIAIQMGDVWRCKWEAYCGANERSTESIPSPHSSRALKVLQYRLEVYCNTRDSKFYPVLILGEYVF